MTGDQNTPTGQPDDEPDAARIVASEELAEQVHELQGAVARLETLLTALQQRLDQAGKPDTPHQEQEPGGGGTTPSLFPDLPDSRPLIADGSSPATSDSTLAPTFILLFDSASSEERRELLALDEWVRGVLVPTYVTQVSSRQPWCACWFEHPEAVARLHALWLAWQELTDETAGGYLGPSLWHRDHLDDAMMRLRSHDGPFAGCMINPKAPAHRRSRPAPTERFGDVSSACRS